MYIKKSSALVGVQIKQMAAKLPIIHASLLYFVTFMLFFHGLSNSQMETDSTKAAVSVIPLTEIDMYTLQKLRTTTVIHTVSAGILSNVETHRFVDKVCVGDMKVHDKKACV